MPIICPNCHVDTTEGWMWDSEWTCNHCHATLEVEWDMNYHDDTYIESVRIKDAKPELP